METIIYVCGCLITRSMFGKREITEIHHCDTHRNLFSQDKSLREMAEELLSILSGTGDKSKEPRGVIKANGTKLD